MKKPHGRFVTGSHLLFFCFSFAALLVFAGCKDLNHPLPLNNYEQVNLVGDNEDYHPQRIDPTLVNPWGIAVNPGGPIWIASTGTGASQVYDKTGAQLIPPVTVPGADPKVPGNPTGIVYNATSDFIIPSTNAISKFIYAGVDGIVSAWSPGNASATVIANNSATSVYTGLTLAVTINSSYLYAADFRTGKIDTWDKNFKPVSFSFTDPGLPVGYSPFNIRSINNLLYVAYAKVDPVTHQEEKGEGFGIINIFTTGGEFVKRFAKGGKLNAPWGLAASGTGFVDALDAILVGNFGDGHINVFNALGEYKGQLMSKDQPIAIEGLWAIESGVPGADPRQLFFTAGVADETHGLFGYIIKK